MKTKNKLHIYLRITLLFFLFATANEAKALLSTLNTTIDGVVYSLSPESVWDTEYASFAYVSGLIDGFSGNANIRSSVTFSDKGQTYTRPVTQIYGCRSAGLVSVSIPNSITYIANNAFKDCTGLKSISLPSSITKISDYTFSGCTSLTSVTIPNSVTKIAPFAFLGCKGLTSLTIPSSVTSIGDRAFNGCTSIKTLYFNAKECDDFKFEYSSYSTTPVTYPPFYNCNIETIVIGNNVKRVPSNLAYEISELKNVTIPNSVTFIGSHAFFKCSNLTNVSIPNSVTSIGLAAFCGCSSLKDINLPNGITNIFQEAFKGCTSITNITIPNSVTTIWSQAFSGCSSLTSITIPNSVTIIHPGAFYNCSGATSISILGNPRIQGKVDNTPAAFAGCSPKKLIWNVKNVNETGMGELNTSQLEEVTFGYGVEVLPSLAGSKISSVNIPNTVKAIGKSIFKDCKNLLSISIPNSVTSIGDYAFSGCSSISYATIGNGVTTIGKNAFYGCTSLKTANLSNNLTVFGEAVFSGCSSLTSVNIPTSISDITKDLFSSCSSLTNITIPNSVISIGERAFRGCNSLSSLTIPYSVTSIANEAFSNCPSLTSIKVNSSNTVYDSRDNCNAIIQKEYNVLIAGCQNTRIPNTVANIGSYAFDGCINLSNITIPNSVLAIGIHAFRNTRLREIVIPDKVMHINQLFSGCKSLKNVVLGSDATFIHENAFSSCDSLKSIHLKSYIIIDNTNCFTSKTYNTATIYAPSELLEGITTYSYWNKFRYFAEETGSSVDLNFNPSQQIGPTSAIMKAEYNGTTPVTDSFFKYNNEVYGDPALITGLDPQKEYRIICGVETANGKLITPRTFSTLALSMTAKAADMITNKDVRLMSETNIADIETSCGFEWRRYDAPEEMPSAKVYCPVFDGVMAGTLKNMSENVYYKYRPFYKSSTGNEYYGDWIAFITADAGVQFEPIVHTYNSPAVTQTDATLQGVALRGSEEIAEQGFEYWKTGKANTLAANDEMTRVTARGERMSKTVNGLQAGTKYTYRAYVIAGGETTYGENVQFATLSNSLDVNLDGEINIADVNTVIDLILMGVSGRTGDVNGDGEVNIADINNLIDAILSK